MKTVAFVLASSHYVKHFFESGILKYLSRDFKIIILIPEKLNVTIPNDSHDFVIRFSHTDSKPFLMSLSSKILAYQKRHKSKSFKYRERRGAQPFTFYGYMGRLNKFFHSENNDNFMTLPESFVEVKAIPQKPKPIKHYVKKIQKYLLMFVDKVLVRYLVRIISFHPKIVKIITRKLSIPKVLKDILKENYDLVVLPTAGMSSIAFYLAKAAREAGMPSLFLVDNWDNLSSKSVMLELPDFMATWGVQSSEHAIQIHGMESTRVFNLGSARFSEYHEIRRTNVNSRIRGEYILFCGTLLPFNEAKCLAVINDEMNSNPKVYGSTRLVYRPHPNSSRLSIPRNLNNLLIDPDFIDIVNTTSKSSEQLSQASLIFNAHLVVTGLSSIVIESAIFGKNTIALAHKENLNLTSPYNVFRNMTHLKGIERLPNLELCLNLNSLPYLLRTGFLLKEHRREDIDKELKYFYDISEPSYSRKLHRIISEIVN